MSVFRQRFQFLLLFYTIFLLLMDVLDNININIDITITKS
jgi:hypothetical protein